MEELIKRILNLYKEFDKKESLEEKYQLSISLQILMAAFAFTSNGDAKKNQLSQWLWMLSTKLKNKDGVVLVSLMRFLIKEGANQEQPFRLKNDKPKTTLEIISETDNNLAEQFKKGLKQKIEIEVESKSTLLVFPEVTDISILISLASVVVEKNENSNKSDILFAKKHVENFIERKKAEEQLKHYILLLHQAIKNNTSTIDHLQKLKSINNINYQEHSAEFYDLGIKAIKFLNDGVLKYLVENFPSEVFMADHNLAFEGGSIQSFKTKESILAFALKLKITKKQEAQYRKVITTLAIPQFINMLTMTFILECNLLDCVPDLNKYFPLFLKSPLNQADPYWCHVTPLSKAYILRKYDLCLSVLDNCDNFVFQDGLGIRFAMYFLSLRIDDEADIPAAYKIIEKLLEKQFEHFEKEKVTVDSQAEIVKKYIPALNPYLCLIVNIVLKNNNLTLLQGFSKIPSPFGSLQRVSKQNIVFPGPNSKEKYTNLLVIALKMRSPLAILNCIVKDFGISVSEPYDTEETIFEVAIRESSKKEINGVLSFLIKNNLDVNRRDKVYGKLPIFFALLRPAITDEICQQLLPTQPISEKESTDLFFVALSSNRFEFAKLLSNNSSWCIDIRNFMGESVRYALDNDSEQYYDLIYKVLRRQAIFSDVGHSPGNTMFVFSLLCLWYFKITSKPLKQYNQLSELPCVKKIHQFSKQGLIPQVVHEGNPNNSEICDLYKHANYCSDEDFFIKSQLPLQILKILAPSAHPHTPCKFFVTEEQIFVMTSIGLAALLGNAEVLETLVKSPFFQPLSQDNKNYFEMVVSSEKSECVKIFLQHNIVGLYNHLSKLLPLEIAIKNNNLIIAGLLLDYIKNDKLQMEQLSFYPDDNLVGLVIRQQNLEMLMLIFEAFNKSEYNSDFRLDIPRMINAAVEIGADKLVQFLQLQCGNDNYSPSQNPDESVNEQSAHSCKQFKDLKGNLIICYNDSFDGKFKTVFFAKNERQDYVDGVVKKLSTCQIKNIKNPSNHKYYNDKYHSSPERKVRFFVAGGARAFLYKPDKEKFVDTENNEKIKIDYFAEFVKHK